ncbi:unnamed protein product [Rotaria sordida]|uniref:SAM domain-containing protein n=1 Tax=Rotaria sordida TaxID=392033 RepID=A0A814FB66_9BILA|nr:unnamed protein product [Rotaria sordida]
MRRWSVNQVGEWLRTIGFEKQIATFKDQNIDGNALKKLTKDDVSRILIVLNEDETIKKPTVGEVRRFREELLEWQTLWEQTKKTNITKTSRTSKTQEHSSKLSLMVVENTSQLFAVENDNNQYKYLIDDHIHVQFFKNPKFASYLINYIQQESFPIHIEIQQVLQASEQSSCSYTLEFSSKQQQAKYVCNIIERLFGTVKSRIYHQNRVKTWLHNPRAVDIIQAIIDNENDLFTVCRASGKRTKVLEIYYFNDEKFNHFSSTVGIDQIIQNNILRIVFVLQLKDNKQSRVPRTTQTSKHDNEQSADSRVNTLSKRQNKQAIQFQEELIEMVKHHNQENGMISVTCNKIVTMAADKNQQHINIFGYFKLVNDVVQQIQDLLNKYRLTKYQLNEMTSMQIDYLINVCRPELKVIEKEFQNDRVHFNIRQRAFNAPPQLKDEIESRINTLLSHITTCTFKTTEFYYDIANRASLVVKTIAQNNRCNCDLKIETTLKACTIPKAIETASTAYSVSKRIIEQSDLFCSSSMVHRQATLANGSFEVLIGDIAAQKVDTIVIPSVSYGLKESLIERAGEIVQQPLEKSGKNSLSFITETTAGRLCCKKILFVNWSLSAMMVPINGNSLRESVRKFISKVIQYIVMGDKHSNMETQSIAFAVPDSCSDEKIVAEEMIYETQRQIQSLKSTCLKVSFILLPDQQTLHQEFLTVISTMEIIDNSYGTLFYPTSTITITLTSSKQDEHCEKEAKYASQISKQIIPVTIQNCTPVDWLQQLLVNRSYFQMFGSEKQFDLVFDKLLLEILQYTTPRDISLKQQISSGTTISAQNQVALHDRKITKLHSPLSVEQRKLIHEMNIEHLISLGKPEIVEDEKKIVLEKAEVAIREAKDQYTEDVRNDQYEQYSPSTYNQKYESENNGMEQQICLNTDGDINNASLLMLNEFLQNPKLSLRPYTKQSSPWTTNSSTKENLKSHLEFAQRMKDNANELARLCEMNMSLIREQSKQQIQPSLTAIFASYTEPQVQETLITTSKNQIPSKFLQKSYYLAFVDKTQLTLDEF